MLVCLTIASLITAECGFPPADTLFTVPEVVVTASRLPTRRDWSPSRVATRAIQHPLAAPSVSVGSALAGMAGLSLREYGGWGAVQTLSVRGTGAEQALVLLDGVPVTNRQSGLTDLSAIPAMLLQGAELRPGGGSSLFGSEAVGGVLNLSTRDPRTVGYLEAFGSTASFGGWSSGLSVDLPLSPVTGIAFGIENSGATGSFPYETGFSAGGPEALRENSDTKSFAAYAVTQTKLANRIIHKLFTSFVSSDKGAPGPVSYSGSAARQSESHLLISDGLQLPLTRSMSFRLAVSWRDSWLRYLDPGGLVASDNYYRNQSFFAAPALEMRAGDREHVVSGADLGLDRAAGNALQEDKTRRHAGWYLSSSFGAYPFASDDGPAFSVFPSFRLDYHEEFGWVGSGGLGVSIGSSRREPSVLLHGTAGNNFRAPTFNELYYAGGGGVGNPGLGPERSTSFDCGVTVRPLRGHEIDLTVFRITTDDRIIWLPLGSPFVWTARNVGTTRTEGLEFAYDWHVLPDRLSLSAHYTAIDAVRISPGDPTAGMQLMYVPLDEGAVEVAGELPLGRWTLLAAAADRYTGIRYAAEDGSASLPSHHLIDLRLAVRFPGPGAEWTIGYVLQNATAVSYQVMPGYPMPLRNHRLMLRLGHSL